MPRVCDQPSGFGNSYAWQNLQRTLGCTLSAVIRIFDPCSQQYLQGDNGVLLASSIRAALSRRPLGNLKGSNKYYYVSLLIQA
jgi:hypothetical protein